MAKQIKIRIYPNGRIEAETVGIQGKSCTDLIPVLEDVLQAETVSSEYTADYYAEPSIQTPQQTTDEIKTNS